MQNRQVIRAKKYLCRYDEIVNEMTKKMLSENITNNITINFIENMIPHHQASIEMSQNLVEFTTYQPLQEIANHIMERQALEIKQMEEIARSTYGISNMKQEVYNYMKKYLEIAKIMIEKMKSTPKLININFNFINQIIPHHEGAIAMCKNLLLYRMDSRLKNLAEDMIKEQSRCLEECKKIQKRFK